MYRSFDQPLMFYYGNPDDANTAFLLRNHCKGNEKRIREQSANFIVRTRSDAGTVQSRDNNYSMWESALKSNAQIISTDYYRPDERWSSYKVGFPGVYKIRH